MNHKIRFGLGAICLMISFSTLIAFEATSTLFTFMSPDGRIEPLMMLSLRLCLAALGPLGLVLLFYPMIGRLLATADGFIQRLETGPFLTFVIGAGLILRAAAVVMMPSHQWADFQSYDELGMEWAQKGGYVHGNHPTAYWPPAYPFLLSRIYLTFGHQPGLALMLNVLFGLSIVILAYLIARKIAGESPARWTALLVTFFPSQILFTGLLASEMLFTPLMLAAVLMFLSFDNRRSGKWYSMLAGGILLGAATMTRAVSKLLLAVVVPYWLLVAKDFRRSLLYGLIAVLGFSIVVVPWMIRNYNAMGVAKINTNTGINLFIGNQPGSGMGYNADLADQYDVNDASQEAQIDSSSWERAWQYILDEPGAFVKRGIIKVIFFYAVDMDAVQPDLTAAAADAIVNYAVITAFVAESYYLLVLLAGVVGAWVYVRRRNTARPPGGFLLLGIILYWTAVHFVFYGMGRYHFPIVPMISIFAAIALKSIVENHRVNY